jgi:hypothetical protein
MECDESFPIEETPSMLEACYAKVRETLGRRRAMEDLEGLKRR